MLRLVSGWRYLLGDEARCMEMGVGGEEGCDGWCGLEEVRVRFATVRTSTYLPYLSARQDETRRDELNGPTQSARPSHYLTIPSLTKATPESRPAWQQTQALLLSGTQKKEDTCSSSLRQPSTPPPHSMAYYRSTSRARHFKKKALFRRIV
jgi:hypothetical protein